MTLGEMTDADEVNPLHFGNDPVDIRIRRRINPELNPGPFSVVVRRLGEGLRSLSPV